jgi:predicted TIM-barrel fold metal-dependent hydrolase
MNQPLTGVPQMLPAQVIDTSTDSREILKHARLAARRRKLHDWFVVDVDAHHVETVSWNEIVQYIEDPVVRDQALHFHKDRIGAPPYGLNGDLGLRYQSVGGRIPHQDGLREKVEETGVHRDVTLTRRAMDSLGVDNMVVFPTPMLFIGLHPQPEMEVWLSRAYNKWMQEKLLSADDRIKFLAVLPYNTPEECERIVKETAGKKGIIGYAVPSTRHAPVHHNKYMRLYRMIEETNLPISFHAGYHWDDPSLKTVNRFLGMHALGFVWPNLVHCTNWVLNGIPVRFPKLKVIWIESGIAWAPFLMQRLDDQFLMRPSEAPAVRVHARPLLVHDAADGGDQPQGARVHLRDDQGGHPAAVRIGLAAFRFRPAERNYRPAVPVRAIQKEHSWPQRGADLQSRSNPGEAAVTRIGRAR